MSLSTFFRSLLQFLKANLVSLAGLSVGMIVTVFSVTYIVFELSYDRFHTDYKKIYQVSTILELQPGNEVTMSSTHQQLKEYIDLNIPQVESCCRLKQVNESIIIDQDKYKNHKGLYIDKEFFSVFSFKMLVGDGSVIDDPNTIILSSDLADKFFGGKNCIGSTLQIKDDIYTVRGIIENPPGNSSIEFEYLIPLSHFFMGLPPTYNFLSVETFFRAVSEIDDYPFMEGLLDNFYKVRDIKNNEMFSIKLSRLADLNQYFHNTSKNFILFIIVSILVLLVSIVNFVNTVAAGSETRIHETGIRKVVGASRACLVRNMLARTIILTLMAAIIGLILSEIFLDYFRELSGIEVEQYGPGLWWIQVTILFIALIAGVAAGVFPAIRYSSPDVISMIRGGGDMKGGYVPLRKILVLFQYTISAGLLITIFIFLSQLRYLSNKDHGYSAESRMLVEVSRALEFKYESYIFELKKIPGIVSITGNGSSFGSTVGMSVRMEKNSEAINALCYFVEDDFFETYGIRVLEGKTFSQTSGIDTGKVIIDAATVDILGLTDPVGQKIYSASLKEVEILGVVDNTDLIARKGKRSPFLYTQFYNLCSELIIHYQGDPAVIARKIAERMTEYDPEFEFNFRTVEEARRSLYKKEVNELKIVLFVGIIALILTLIGAYSMAAYMAERRSKEISIRKVMGATVSEVLQLSFREMAWMILLAFIIASPVAYYMSNRWLENFTEKISIGPVPFILSAVILTIMIFAAVYYRERKAAMANPVDNLRQQ